jgi:acetyl esterase/lipase
MLTWLIWLLGLVIAAWAFARLVLDGEDLSRFDQPAPEPVNTAPSAANTEVVRSVKEFAREAESSKGGRERLKTMREAMDAMGDNADLSGLRIEPVTVAGRPAEWLARESGEVTGRLLYLHGGAFTMGSPRSHRPITTELARRAGLAVLAIDYRLMPEHSRRAGVEDCRAAYRWLLDHGPTGQGPAEAVFVAGDSAGGNLALALIGWLRDQRGDAAGLRQVDGAIALSPLTDATFASPSMRYNIDQDPMLGPMARMIQRVPRSLMLWSTWLQNRIRPTDPLLSPLRDDLSNLPPVLVQASEAEILIDDARRYANKARDAGSPVEIETWHGMVHVWQAFGTNLPESDQAFERMAAFVRRVLESRGQANAA